MDKDLKITVLERVIESWKKLLREYWHLEPLSFKEIVVDTAISEDDYIEYRSLLEYTLPEVLVVNQKMIEEWTVEYNEWVKLR